MEKARAAQIEKCKKSKKFLFATKSEKDQFQSLINILKLLCDATTSHVTRRMHFLFQSHSLSLQTQTDTHTYTHTHSLSHEFFLTHTHSLEVLSHAHTFFLSLSHTHTFPFTLSLNLSLSHKHAHSLQKYISDKTKGAFFFSFQS